jgi:hypothetical protein
MAAAMVGVARRHRARGAGIPDLEPQSTVVHPGGDMHELAHGRFRVPHTIRHKLRDQQLCIGENLAGDLAREGTGESDPSSPGGLWPWSHTKVERPGGARTGRVVRFAGTGLNACLH